ncbi:MAG: hypothetical protein JW798_02815 [Prolixibacteraceae bacterium]|nr:hypothetical protein [Prolixibacteraceae bacterium]
MGFFESAVVVYMRYIAYPGGFDFPLQPIDQSLALTEFLREVFSMLMLGSVAFLITRNHMERFAWFIYNFAVWDIFYYIFLKLLLNWPESLFTMDILFLIPVIWTGPVLAPVLLSMLMIVLAVLIIKKTYRGQRVKFTSTEWILFFGGSAIVILSFILDYLIYFCKQNTFGELFSMKMHLEASADYEPERFLWWVFIIGFIAICSGITIFFLRTRHFISKYLNYKEA